MKIPRSHELNLCLLLSQVYSNREIKLNNRKKIYGEMHFVLTNVMKWHATRQRR